MSCGKSTYYVYEDSVYNNIQKKNIILSYYAIEVTPKKEVIFKAVSNNLGSGFVYIYTDRYNCTANDEEISFCRNFTFINYLHTAYPLDWKFASTNNFNIKGAEVSYTNYGKKETDTLKLIENQNFRDLIQKDEGFKAAGIYWFPPYIVKTKKIDYNKFYEYSSSLKKANIEKKNPMIVNHQE